MDRIIAFIPARGGSKSIPLKNIKPIAGRPLIFWTIDAVIGCELIDRVYISTDSAEIKNSLQSLQNSKIRIIGRSEETATDLATTETAMIEFAKRHSFEKIVLIQATAPLLTSEDLSKALNKLDVSGADSLLSLVRQKRFLWKQEGEFVKPVNYDYRNRPRRQDFEGFLVENGAFYITTRNDLLKTNCRLSGKLAYHEMDGESYFEIDEPSDWIIAEHLLKSRIINRYSSKLRNIKLLACDVDGVLTDSGMYYSDNSEEFKKFNTRDGKGFEIIRKVGIKTAIITSENTKIVENRATKLKTDYVFQGIINKASKISEIANNLNISLDEIAYIGDDINDNDVLKIVGFSACPSDAIDDNKDIVDYVCIKKGGEGCFREVCDLIISNMKRHD